VRHCGPRHTLSAATQAQLLDETVRVTAIYPVDARVAEARRRYDRARQATWFTIIVDLLRGMAGPGGNCMWCSSNESSQVEHYRPKSQYPELAFHWENYLWACGVCNSIHKRDQFPENPHQIIDPVTEDPWQHFFIDEFGMLSPRYDPVAESLDTRAVSTISVLGLVRDDLQARRRRAMKILRQSVYDALVMYRSDRLTVQDLRDRLVELRANEYHPDVSQYFLDGPGAEEEPFRTFLNVATIT
jgi:uncharacterized protein (TIGR02646 family)